MSGKRSLRQVLARQWIAFTLVLLAGFAAMAVLLLFLLEDSFIDGRLRDVAADVVRLETAQVPERFTLHALADAPAELRGRMQGRRLGGTREFRLDDGRYVHALAGRTPAGEDYLLVYDVSDQLRVNEALARAWPWLLAMAVVLCVVAWLLAREFVARISRQARGLVASIGGDAAVEASGLKSLPQVDGAGLKSLPQVDGAGLKSLPQVDGAGLKSLLQLRALAESERITEFGELARLAADAWESRLQALERERETLAFLGHELRTPLQSARTSLALLQDDRGNDAAWQRLQRAQDRLVRASHSVLWLASDAAPAGHPGGDIVPLLQALVEEFAPLAATRQQTLLLTGPSRLDWPLPPEIAETVIANGLLNAIQHGGAGEIRIEAAEDWLRIDNPRSPETLPAGFGLGLSLAQRLLARFGWTVTREEAPTHTRLRIGTTPRAA